MALFKTAKRNQVRPTQGERAARALDLLCGLAGYWEGVRREWNPDEGGLRENDRTLSTLYELNLDGTHLIAHTNVSGDVASLHNFDVWGRDDASAELVRTVFSDGLRHSNAYAVSSLKTGRDPKVWQLVLETISWDEGRPCEIRHQITRSNSRLDLKVERRLISSGMEYENMSQAKLTRKR